MADESHLPGASPRWSYYREPVSFRWKGNLLVTVWWAQIDERWEMVGVQVHVHPEARARPLQRKDLDLKMGDLYERAADELEKLLRDERVFSRQVQRLIIDEASDGFTFETVPNAEVDPANYPKRHGDRPVSPMLQEVADVYNAACRRGDPKPTKAVREHFGFQRDNAAQWVFRARKAGLLPETTPGVARGRKLRGRRPPQDDSTREGSEA